MKKKLQTQLLQTYQLDENDDRFFFLKKNLFFYFLY